MTIQSRLYLKLVGHPMPTLTARLGVEASPVVEAERRKRTRSHFPQGIYGGLRAPMVRA